MAGCALTGLAFVITACAPGEEETESSDAYSTVALSELFPNDADRVKVETITRKIWEGLEPHGCQSCHSTPAGPGWEAAKMPYFDYWKSAVIVHLDLVDRETSQPTPTNFKLYRQLSGQIAPIMPPRPEGSMTDEGATLLNGVQGFGGELRCTGSSNAAACREELWRALGGAPIYTNRTGVCIDHVRLEHVSAPSLCESFAELSKFIATWRSTPQQGVKAWLDVVKKAATLDHYDKLEGIISDGNDGPGAGPIVSGGEGSVVGKGRVLFATARDTTVSFYTRVAPDDSAIAFTQTSATKKFDAKMVDLRNIENQFGLQNISYDPTFSPDYSVAEKKGFIVGARGTLSSETEKLYSFYVPGTRGEPVLTLTLPEISGYGSLARITAANKGSVADKWRQLQERAGDFTVVMGKRWKWFAVQPKVSSAGATTGIKVLSDSSVGLPGGNGVAAPVCRTITDATGRNDTAVGFAESMISGDGRWIALNSQMDGALLLVSTKTCAIEHVATFRGKAMQGSKAAFSVDGNLVTFHAFGEDGLSAAENGVANNGAIRTLAEGGRISNIFVYDTRTKQTRQITDYKREDRTVAWFPNFNGDGSKIYYHRHRAGQRASEVLVVESGASQ